MQRQRASSQLWLRPWRCRVGPQPAKGQAGRRTSQRFCSEDLGWKKAFVEFQGQPPANVFSARRLKVMKHASQKAGALQTEQYLSMRIQSFRMIDSASQTRLARPGEADAGRSLASSCRRPLPHHMLDQASQLAACPETKPAPGASRVAGHSPGSERRCVFWRAAEDSQSST